MEKVRYSAKRSLIMNLLVFLILFACTIVILHGLPLVLDDHGFVQVHYHSAREAFLDILKFGNGRFFGNGGIIFLLHHMPLHDVVRAGVLAGIALLLPMVLGIKDRWFYPFVVLFLLLTISPGIFSQVFSWMSGFQNYVPPLLILLIAILLLYSKQYNNVINIFRYLFILLCGMCMQFYIEHSSCLNVLTALALTLYSGKRDRARLPSCIVLLAGTVLGLAMMFAATFFLAPQIHGGVHTYLDNGVISFVMQSARNAVVLLGMYTENAISLGLMGLLLLVFVEKNRLSFSNIERMALWFGLGLTSCSFGLNLIAGLRPWYGKLAIAESAFLVLLLIIYGASVIYTLRRLWKSTAERRFQRALILCCAAVISLLPVMVVSPTGYRCLFHSSLMLFGAVLLLIDEFYAKIHNDQKRALFRRIVTSVVLVTFFSFSTIFHDIRRMINIRDEYLTEMARTGAEAVETFTIPSPYIYEVWNEEYEHYTFVEGKRIKLEILPADVWFRLNYYHYK